jgi:hypothetical protein
VVSIDQRRIDEAITIINNNNNNNSTTCNDIQTDRHHYDLYHQSHHSPIKYYQPSSPAMVLALAAHRMLDGEQPMNKTKQHLP